LELEREAVVQRLCQAYAQDQLTTQELETRLERVYQARVREELTPLVAGLAPATPLAAPARFYDLAPAGQTAPEERLLSVFSGVVRKGRWTPPARLRVVAVMGSVELDFREARLAPVTEIRADAVMGSVEITVPPGVEVQVRATAFLGAVEDKSITPDEPDAPVLLVTGAALAGSVEVKTRLPKETALQALKREWLGGRSRGKA
jgi:hypothetical protein